MDLRGELISGDYNHAWMGKTFIHNGVKAKITGYTEHQINGNYFVTMTEAGYFYHFNSDVFIQSLKKGTSEWI